MASYILRRVLLMFPTLIGITMVVFLVMALSPGGVGGSFLDQIEAGTMRPEQREAMRRYYEQRYGLRQPLLVQYGRWLNQVSPVGFDTNEDGSLRFTSPTFKAPNLGESFLRNRPVVDVVMERLPVTLLLNLITVPIIYGIAVTSGIYAAQQRGQLFDVGSGTLLLALWALPVMWVGVMLIGFLANRDFIQWFPTGGLHSTQAQSFSFLPRWTDAGFERGWLLDLLWHLVLPVMCLVYGGFAFLSKLMRASMLENLSADFVRTARAKGQRERTILFTHVLRNSILPLITVAAGILPGLLSGSLIVEQIFSIRGMGALMIEAINTRDRELVLSTTFVISIISMISLLIADLCYAVADPRVSYD